MSVIRAEDVVRVATQLEAAVADASLSDAAAACIGVAIVTLRRIAVADVCPLPASTQTPKRKVAKRGISSTAIRIMRALVEEQPLTVRRLQERLPDVVSIGWTCGVLASSGYVIRRPKQRGRGRPQFEYVLSAYVHRSGIIETWADQARAIIQTLDIRARVLRAWTTARIYNRQSVSAQVTSHWPFIAKSGASDNALVTQINNAVPKRLPEEIRQEVCQDLALAILSGELSESDLETAIETQIRKALRAHPGNAGMLSLDAPAPSQIGDRRPMSWLIATE